MLIYSHPSFFATLAATALIAAAFSGGAATAQEQEADVEQLIARIDQLYRSQTSYSTIEMLIVTPNWQRRLRLKMWTEGMDKTFIHLTHPPKDAGITTLQMDTEMWNYFPKINKVMKVPPSMMMSSWMGSDFTNDDLVKESTLMDDYVARLVPGVPEQSGLYLIELVPKEQTPTVWSRVTIEIRRRDLMPLRQFYYDEKGRKMRRLEFGDIKVLGGRKIPALMELVPLNKEGHRTVIRYLEAHFGGELDRDIFTLRNLRKKR